MTFRFKAFGWHLLASACLMSLVLGALYLGWYRWPGWYLAGALKIALLMSGFDVILGPLLTLVVANPAKPRRALARDIGIIICVQIVAAGYGTATLWHGRILYYTYSDKFLEMVQAADLDPKQVALGEQLNPEWAPHWYSRPRWMYAPLPKDEKQSNQIVTAAITGGEDVIQMPRYYKPWQTGLAELGKQLRVVDKMTEFSLQDKQTLAQRMRQMGFAPDQPVALPMMGKDKPLLAVFDPKSLQIKAFIKAD
jgi:hypothetical protein